MIASRRKLNHVLQQLHLGVTGAAAKGVPARNPGGLLASVADDKKPVVEQWIGQMELVVTAINDLSRDDEKKYLETLEEQTAALREFLGLEEKIDLPGVPAAMAAKASAAARSSTRRRAAWSRRRRGSGSTRRRACRTSRQRSRCTAGRRTGSLGWSERFSDARTLVCLLSRLGSPSRKHANRAASWACGQRMAGAHGHATQT